MNFLDNIKNWPFLQEPLYRWFIFFGAFIVITMCWRILLKYIKE